MPTLPPSAASAQASAAFRVKFNSACRNSPSSPPASPNVPSHPIFTCGSVSLTSATTRSTIVCSATLSSGISSGRAYFRNSVTTCVMFRVCSRMRSAIQSFGLGRLRPDHLRVTRNRRQRVLELVRDSRGQFAQGGQVFLQLNPLLERGKFRQIRQQTDRSADLSLATPDGGNRHSQMACVSSGRNMLDFFAAKNFSVLKALRYQPGHP